MRALLERRTSGLLERRLHLSVPSTQEDTEGKEMKRTHWHMIAAILGGLLGVWIATAEASAEIRRLEIPGGTYTEAFPSAAGLGDVFSVRVGDVLTSRGNVAFGASGLPLYARGCVNGSRLLLAGQGHDSGHAVYFDGSEWQSFGPAHGVNVAAFDPRDCRLWIVRSGDLASTRTLTGEQESFSAAFGSQGIRYIRDDGSPVTGDSTYGSADLNLFEYTICNGIAIGQGGNGGLVAVGPSGRRVLEPGETYFVRANCAGSQFAVATWKPRERKAVALWFDASDLASFPADGPSVPVPSPKPKPEPPPAPAPVQTASPDPAFVEYANRRWRELKVEERVRALPADASREQLAGPASDALIEIVSGWHHGHGGTDVFIYPKAGGTCHRYGNYSVEVNGRRYDCFGEDIVLLKRGALLFWADVGVAFGSRDPRLNIGEFNLSDQPEMFAPPPVLGASQPKPEPKPAPSCADCERKLAEAEIKLAEARRDLDDARAKVSALQSGIANISDNLSTSLKDLASERARAEAAEKALADVKCEAERPRVLRVLGIGVGCKVIR